MWRAEGPGGVPAALKFVRLDRSVGPREWRAVDVMRAVRHPHLVSMSGVWEIDGRLVVAMELADRTLDDRWREARRAGEPGIPAAELLQYMADAADGLDYLRSALPDPDAGPGAQGQHCDVKPQNLLLVGGRVKVSDYGLVRVLRDTVASNSGGYTPAFAAPEMFSGKVSTNSDQYSLAVTYCQMRGGRLPFEGNAAEVMKGHLEGSPNLSTLPEGERRAVRKALSKTPSRRWPSCREFVAALRQAQAGQVQPRPEAVPPGGGRRAGWSVRLGGRRWVRWAVAALILIVAIALAWGVRARLRPGAPQVPPEATGEH